MPPKVDYRRVGAQDCTHPDDLVTHLRVDHRLGLDSFSPDAGSPEHRAILELCHAQRHAGWGVGADHPADSHDYETKGFA